MESGKRWYRKWNLDMSKEEVKAIIDASMTPDKYNHCIFDGPYTPPDCADFNGKSFVFRGEGRAYGFDFVSANLVRFSENGGAAKECFCHVKTLEGEVYLVNHLVPGAETARQITLVFDTATGYATICDARIGTENSSRDVGREFIFGRMDGIFNAGKAHSFTSELVGKAVIWDYGDGGTEVKHIYNSNLFYTYTMASPNGAWMASNPADFIKVRDNMYIFSFVEERQPGLQMLLLIDMDKMHDVGSCWGIGGRNNFFSACVGAKGRAVEPVTVF